MSEANLKPNPFIERNGGGLYNPLTDLHLSSDDPACAAIADAFTRRSEIGGVDVSMRERLVRDEWLVRSDADLSRRFRLKIVSLETNSVCNQGCYFCPVSIDPREATTMPDEMFERIVEELKAHRATLEGVFLQSYNEPTADRRFVEHVRILKDAGLPVAVLSNGSGLMPAKVDALVAMGGIRYLCINLSTLDREKYKEDRGADHLPIVLKNMLYAKDQRIAEQMKIVVLGTGDERHARDFEEIRTLFAGSRFNVEHHTVMDRAGYLEVGLSVQTPDQRLRGCDNLGSRPLQHLHITASGKCVLCCEDYDENYVVGDLAQSSVREVLEGDELAKFRRFAYGIDHAPDDFICRKCIFAKVD